METRGVTMVSYAVRLISVKTGLLLALSLDLARGNSCDRSEAAHSPDTARIISTPQIIRQFMSANFNPVVNESSPSLHQIGKHVRLSLDRLSFLI